MIQNEVRQPKQIQAGSVSDTNKNNNSTNIMLSQNRPRNTWTTNTSTKTESQTRFSGRFKVPCSTCCSVETARTSFLCGNRDGHHIQKHIKYKIIQAQYTKQVLKQSNTARMGVTSGTKQSNTTKIFLQAVCSHQNSNQTRRIDFQ